MGKGFEGKLEIHAPYPSTHFKNFNSNDKLWNSNIKDFENIMGNNSTKSDINYSNYVCTPSKWPRNCLNPDIFAMVTISTYQQYIFIYFHINNVVMTDSWALFNIYVKIIDGFSDTKTRTLTSHSYWFQYFLMFPHPEKPILSWLWLTNEIETKSENWLNYCWKISCFFWFSLENKRGLVNF